jgi:hypothetical protein
MMIEEAWMQPYLAYMINKKLPEDAVEAKRITRQSKAFVVLQGKLYKKSITGVLQRCITPQEGQIILKIYTPEYVAIMLAGGQSRQKRFEQDSIG